MRLPTTTLSLLAIAPAAAAAEERTYTDDLGVVHTTTKEKPTIVTFAHTAVSAFDYGLGTDQLIGTYGEYLVEGSTFDFDMPEQASAYSADPEPEDIARLLETTNLSPDCERTPGYCTSFDVAGLVELDPDFLVVHGYAGRPWGFSNFTEIQLNFPEERIIFNDVSLEGDNCTATENCYGKSMIGMVEQYRELGAFLGVEEGPELQADFADLCEAAKEFSAHMETAHEKGIRTMASYVDPTSGFYASPVNDMVLRMFEELGMPILHIGACANCSLSYFWETIPVESYFKSCEVNTTDFSVCNEDPLYPIDVWLYDHRVRGTVNNEDFGVVFPDKAILAGQFVEWPIGGRKITPAHAAEILRSVGPAVAGFDRIHGETDCVPDIDVSGLDHRQSGEGVKGAGAGQYACYNSDFHNQKYFQGCADVAASDAGEKDDTDDHDHSEHDHGDEEKETDEPALEADEPTVKPDESDSSASRSSALAALAVAALTMVYGM
mmetsp:Transcript_21443/g.47652  ORF Transcript_21443/g.47652 Transcript_21443/m.47652 type:complete len:493 (+) Transcript_21443:305-1783(+)